MIAPQLGLLTVLKHIAKFASVVGGCGCTARAGEAGIVGPARAGNDLSLAHLFVLLHLGAALGFVQIDCHQNCRGSDLGRPIGQESRFVHHVT